MVVPLICNSLAFMLTTGMVLYEHIDPVAMFYVTIVTCVAAGTFMAVLQSGVFSLAAQFPQKYSQPLFPVDDLTDKDLSHFFGNNLRNVEEKEGQVLSFFFIKRITMLFYAQKKV